MTPFAACLNPQFNNFLSISDSFFISISVRFASWKFGHSDNVRIIWDTPLNYHRIVITLFTHLAPLLAF
jgi:hypothetical protein